jgi:hypothetical protein
MDQLSELKSGLASRQNQRNDSSIMSNAIGFGPKVARSRDYNKENFNNHRVISEMRHDPYRIYN